MECFSDKLCVQHTTHYVHIACKLRLTLSSAKRTLALEIKCNMFLTATVMFTIAWHRDCEANGETNMAYFVQTNLARRFDFNAFADQGPASMKNIAVAWIHSSSACTDTHCYMRQSCEKHFLAKPCISWLAIARLEQPTQHNVFVNGRQEPRKETSLLAM